MDELNNLQKQAFQGYMPQGNDFSQMVHINPMTNNLTMPTPPQSNIEDTITYYQQEACRLYIANVVLTNQVKELLAEKNELQSKIAKLEKKQQENMLSLAEEKKKRHRRSAREIERHYKCPVETCQKSYGSEGSLAQHIKIKHPDFYNQISNNISQTLSKMRQETNSEDDQNKQQISNTEDNDIEKEEQSEESEKQEEQQDSQKVKKQPKKNENTATTLI